jgi:hypothetical protein
MLILRPPHRNPCHASDHQKIRFAEHLLCGQHGELQRTVGRRAIAVVEKLAGIGFVDDAVIGIGGGACQVGLEDQRVEPALGEVVEQTRAAVLQLDRIGEREIADAVDVG